MLRFAFVLMGLATGCLMATAANGTPTKYPIAADTTQISAGKYLLIKGSIAGDTLISLPTWMTIGRSTLNGWWRKANLKSEYTVFNPNTVLDFDKYSTFSADSIKFNLGFNNRYGYSTAGPANHPTFRTIKAGKSSQFQMMDSYVLLYTYQATTVDSGAISLSNRNSASFQYLAGSPSAVFTSGITTSMAYPHTNGIKSLNTNAGDDTSCVLFDVRQGSGDANRYRVTGDGMSWQRGGRIGSWVGHNGYVDVDSVGKVSIVAADTGMATLQVDAVGTFHQNTNVAFDNTRRKAGTAFKHESYRDGILGVRMYHYGTGAAGSTLTGAQKGYTIVDTLGRWGFLTPGYPDSTVSIGGGIHTSGGVQIDGTLTFTNGPWRDVIVDASRLKVKGASGIVYDDSSATIIMKGSVDSTTEYISTNFQFNHDRDPASAAHPHVHFWQTSSSRPYFKMWYRWQQNGQAKTQTWTAVPCTTLAYTYTSGTLNQMAEYDSIPAPVNSGLSDILQIKLTRNPGGAGDPGAGVDYNVLGLDVHYRVNTVGSRLELTK